MPVAVRITNSNAAANEMIEAVLSVRLRPSRAREADCALSARYLLIFRYSSRSRCPAAIVPRCIRRSVWIRWADSSIPASRSALKGALSLVTTGEASKAAFLEALNEMVCDSDTYLNRLRENLEAAINSANPMSAEALSAKMAELQRELINRTERRENYDDITEEILRLRELQEQKGMDDATQKEHTKRIKELQKFIQSQPSEITEFDEALVKKLLEKVTVHDDYLEFRFKSGVTINTSDQCHYCCRR